jgi:hypothetical protein
MRLRRGETVQTQTPSLPFWGGDHLRRPRGALGLPPRTPMRKPDASLRVRRSSRGLNRVWLDDSQSKRRLRSSSDCNAIWNKLRRHAAFSLSLLPGGKIPSRRGNAPTGKATGVTARPPFIGRIDIIIRCRLPFQITFATFDTLLVSTATCRAFDAAAPRGDCARPEEPTAQTPSLPLGVGDHLRRPRNALRLFRPFLPPEGSRSRAAAGAQIITGQELIAYSAQTAAQPIR